MASNQDAVAAKTSRPFFDRRSIEQKKKKPQLVYQIFLCTKCLQEQDVGAWSAIIVQQSPSSGDAPERTAYMISARVESQDHISTRLNGVLESLKWLTDNVEAEQLPCINATLVVNDPFIVNLLREWLPKWVSKGGGTEETGADVPPLPNLGGRPHVGILGPIAAIAGKIKLTIKWASEKSYELSCSAKKMEELLAEPMQVKDEPEPPKP